MDKDTIRKQIDAIDTKILDLLSERINCAQEIGREKIARGEDVYVPSREMQVFNNLLEKNSGRIEEESLKAIYREIISASISAEKKILRKVVLFDVYRGDKIPEGKKQYAISLTLQDYDKTLTDKYVEQVVGRVLNALSSQFGAVLR